MTFSIVGADPVTGEVGVAVASRFPAVGAVVPYVERGVGAVATQSFVHAAYGPDGLARLREGATVEQALDAVAVDDPDVAIRQVGIVAADGSSATRTGDACLDWAGGAVLDGAAVQGNILIGPVVIEAMASAWSSTRGRPLADRLLAALEAGDLAGGDRRGRQAASLRVLGAGAGYGGALDAIDLRVDDHVDPVSELARLLGIHRLVFGTTPEAEWVAIGDAEVAAIRHALGERGVAVPAGDGWDADLERVLLDWVVMENLDERWTGGDRIDPVVLGHLLGR